MRDASHGKTSITGRLHPIAFGPWSKVARRWSEEDFPLLLSKHFGGPNVLAVYRSNAADFGLDRLSARGHFFYLNAVAISHWTRNPPAVSFPSGLEQACRAGEIAGDRILAHARSIVDAMPELFMAAVLDRDLEPIGRISFSKAEAEQWYEAQARSWSTQCKQERLRQQAGKFKL